MSFEFMSAPLREWSLLFCGLTRMEMRYRAEGREGERKWILLKVLMYLYSLGTASSVSSICDTFGFGDGILPVFDEFVKDGSIKVFYVHGSVGKGSVLKNTVIELTLDGRMMAERLIVRMKEDFDAEIASQNAIKMLGTY